MVSFEDALKNILDEVSPLGQEKVGIVDAIGRVIGEDVSAGRDLPPNDNSAMDGYALRAIDTRGSSAEKPCILDVVETIPAGAVPREKIGKGKAARIMTGAPIPNGADAVVPLEKIRQSDGRVAVFAEAKASQDIRYAGGDVRRGEKVIARGVIIRPAEVGMLAALGRAFISVYQRPLVAIISTGNELEDIDSLPSPGKIVNSNSYALAARVRECGAVPLQIGIARDNREDLAEKVRAALRADLIVSTGGVSVGDYDLVKEIMKDAGNEMRFWQVAMKPGRSLAFGKLGAVPILGLPGNPGASMVSFEQFIRPAILKMLGHRNLYRRTVRARLDEDIKKKAGMRHFIWAQVRPAGQAYAVATTGRRGSGVLTSMVRANGLIILPEASTAVRTGDMVTVQLLDDSLQWSSEPES